MTEPGARLRANRGERRGAEHPRPGSAGAAAAGGSGSDGMRSGRPAGPRGDGTAEETWRREGVPHGSAWHRVLGTEGTARTEASRIGARRKKGGGNVLRGKLKVYVQKVCKVKKIWKSRLRWSLSFCPRRNCP